MTIRKGTTPCLIDPADVHALLQDGPKASGILARWLNQPQTTVIACCQALVREGRIVQLPYPDRRWALPGAPVEATAAAPVQPLRQTAPNKKATGVSWWTNAEREGFTGQAEQQQARMGASKQAKFVTGKILE